jgi:hypothetical protein
MNHPPPGWVAWVDMMRLHQGIDSSFSQTFRCIEHQVIAPASERVVPTISASVSCKTLGVLSETGRLCRNAQAAELVPSASHCAQANLDF